ncbi:MAG: hypothetical protein FJX64_10260 [Alphaproteobacteria bacterium]|nr:hypothetical protein [Alphaproteobacteria bacterium]
MEATLAKVNVRLLGIPRTALFLAGFFVGAHAAVADLALLTRDTRRYATYFPKVMLIAPSNAGT